MTEPLIGISAFLKLFFVWPARRKFRVLFSCTQAGKIACFVCAKTHLINTLCKNTLINTLINQACLSKVAGYWSHSCFFCILMGLYMHIKMLKKIEQDQYPKPSYM